MLFSSERAVDQFISTVGLSVSLTSLTRRTVADPSDTWKDDDGCSLLIFSSSTCEQRLNLNDDCPEYGSDSINVGLVSSKSQALLCSWELSLVRPERKQAKPKSRIISFLLFFFLSKWVLITGEIWRWQIKYPENKNKRKRRQKENDKFSLLNFQKWKVDSLKLLLKALFALIKWKKSFKKRKDELNRQCIVWCWCDVGAKKKSGGGR